MRWLELPFGLKRGGLCVTNSSGDTLHVDGLAERFTPFLDCGLLLIFGCGHGLFLQGTNEIKDTSDELTPSGFP
jgi:hypothetical protein